VLVTYSCLLAEIWNYSCGFISYSTPCSLPMVSNITHIFIPNSVSRIVYTISYNTMSYINMITFLNGILIGWQRYRFVTAAILVSPVNDVNNYVARR